MIKKSFKIITINILIFFVGLILIEIFFGSWFSNSNYQNLLIPRQQKDILDNLPYSSDKIGIYTRDKHGFRANTYSLDKIEILILGGSTTEERDVDDKLIWTKIFEKNLNNKKKVLNAGIGGQTSYGHNKIFEIWLSKFNDLKPKYTIIYLGINDALFLIENFNKKIDYGEGRILNKSNRDLLKNTTFQDQVVQYIKNNSVFHTIYLLIKGNIISRKYKINYNKGPGKFIAHYSEPPEKDIVVDLFDMNKFYDYYNNNILNIIKSNKVYNSKIIFVTQKISEKHWLNDFLKIVNYFTKSICIANDLICFNLHEQIVLEEEKDFYDGMHTTPSGSKKIGRLIADFFNRTIN